MAKPHYPASSSTGTAPLGTLVRMWRERALLTQEELAQRAGLSVGTIRGVEAGRIRQPRTGSVRLLAGALSLSEQDQRRLVAAARSGPAGGDPGRAHRSVVVPAQLPSDVPGFHGRRVEGSRLDGLASAAEQAPTPVIALLVGPPGVGKSALALHFAHQVRDRFPDGQLYLNLHGYAPAAPVRPIEALADLLHGLGTPVDRIPAAVTAATGMYRSLLADRRVLVVLDNAGSADQVRPLLPAGRGCLVLVTSRDRLGGLVAREGAHLITLDVLRPDEARGLIADVLTAERAEAEPEAVEELARLCGYLPLALRIAAANLVGRPQQTIAGYAARLGRGNRLALLHVDEDEQAAVRVAFDQSYAALGADDRRLFRLLGLVPGADVTVPAAAALAGVSSPEAEAGLDRLAAGHLVQQHRPGRYTWHDLLRLYAAARAQEEEAEPVRRAAVDRLLEWYLANVRAAAHRLYPERRTGRQSCAADLHSQALDLARETGHPYPEAEALLGLAAADRDLGRLEPARETAEQALAIAVRTGYRILECQARERLGDLLDALGQPGPAAAELRRARAIRQATGYAAAPVGAAEAGGGWR